MACSNINRPLSLNDSISHCWRTTFRRDICPKASGNVRTLWIPSKSCARPTWPKSVTVVIKTYRVYHIELHEQRYYFHNDVVLHFKKRYVISVKSSNTSMPISSLFKRYYVFWNLTQIHGIFRRHIIFKRCLTLLG